MHLWKLNYLHSTYPLGLLCTHPPKTSLPSGSRHQCNPPGSSSPQTSFLFFVLILLISTICLMTGSCHVVAKLHSISKDYQNKVMECSFFFITKNCFILFMEILSIQQTWHQKLCTFKEQMATLTIKIRWMECIWCQLQFGLAGTTKIEFQYFELSGMIWCIFQSHNKISMIELEHSSVSVINRYKDLNENEAISHERPWGMLPEAVHCEQN